MRRSSWLDELRTTLGQFSPSRGQRLKRRPPTLRRPAFEPLEDRALLTLLTVNSPLDNNIPDDGLVTLREAIIAANANTTTDLGQTGSGADTIEFDPAAFATTRTMQLGFGELIITESLTINGPGRDLLTIDALHNSRIFNITTPTPGAIHTIARLTLTGGMANGDGGAILASNAGNPAIDQCTIRDSRASGSGGGIYARGILTITNSTLSDNSAVDKGGGFFAGFTTTITNTLMSNNSATGPSAEGGGFYADWHVTIRDSSITGNSAEGAGGGGFTTIYGAVSVTNSTFTDNSAGAAGGGFHSGSGVSVIDSEISNNHAVGSGGGFRSGSGYRGQNGGSFISNSRITGNTSMAGGGGFTAANTRLSNSVVTGNSSGGSGGGFSLSGRSVTDSNPATLIGTIVSGNTAAVSGGGFFVGFEATLDNSTLSGNTGGGIHAGYVGPFGPVFKSVTLNSSTVSVNSKVGPGAGIFAGNVTLNSSTVDGNTSMATAGGIYSGSGNVTVNSSTVSGNTSKGAGAGIYARRGTNARTSVANSTVAGNIAVDGAGGGIWNDSNAIDVSASIVAGNIAGGGNPDLRPGTGVLTVRVSLIGDNAGTSLTETHVPDANGNLVGSSGGGGNIDPKLAPLANNGGPTRTHALLPGSPALDAIPLSVGPPPAHDYQLNGTLTDVLGGPSMVALGGNLQPNGYHFSANQGLHVSSALANPGTYSIVLDFRWNNLTGGWYKIIDFHNLASNVGLYTAGTGLYFLDRAFAPSLFGAGILAQVVITRDDATDLVRAYVYGNEVWSFNDVAGEAVFDGPSQIIRFFQDDNVTNQSQAQGGFVDRVRLYNDVLTPAEINALATTPPLTIPDFDQRGMPFARVKDGDGVRGPQIDMGAFELQEPPAPIQLDYGDAPDTGPGTGLGNYNTLDSDNGPRHGIEARLRLGASVDSDLGTLQNKAANADDVDGALPDDEDGVANPSADLALTIGAQPTVIVRATNTTGAAATLYGWIDYNANGVFENASERTSASVPDGSNNTTFTLVFPVVPSGFTGTTYARFRMSSDSAAANPTGLAANGEVEDYPVTIVSPSDLSADSSKTKLLASGTNGAPIFSAGDLFGSAVATLGDLDGDGVTDLAVGANGDDTGGFASNRGAVHILFMNADGTVRDSQKIAHNLGGGPMLAEIDAFGRSVAAIGDLDGDGVTELAVGAVGDNIGGNNRGAVYILFLNANGTAKGFQKIASGVNGGPVLANEDRFGWSVASLGDLDGDGVADMAAGLINLQFADGAVYVLFMNSNGTVKGSQRIAGGVGGGPPVSRDSFGSALAALGDVDNDGITDLAVGASGDSSSVSSGGAVHVLFLNMNGTVKNSQKIASGVSGGPSLSNDSFGSSLTSLGDIDGDGLTDLAVGAERDDTGGGSSFSDRGSVYLLLLNANGTVKSSRKIANGTGGGPPLADGDHFGSAVAALHDLDGDGLTDMAVGSLSGAVHVLFLKTPNANPVFTSPNTANVIEQTTFVMNVTATDADVPPQTVTFSLVGGADRTKFSLTSGGALSFMSPPDFDIPTDANGNNVYEVVVQASDSNGGFATQTINVTVIESPYDYGDAPDTGIGTGPGNYNTSATDNGPRHTIVPGFYLGGAIDGDSGLLQNNSANADDIDSSLPDDEDGVVNPLDLVLTVGTAPRVTVRVTNTRPLTFSFVVGWIDYNADGVFDNETERATHTPFPGGYFTLMFPIVPDVFTGTTYARFRLSEGSFPESTGPAPSGEVEDYRVTILRPSTGLADPAKNKKIASGISGGPPLANGDMFGAAVAGIGDLDGDGVEDLAVGAPSQSGTPTGGAVHVLFMNAGGTVKSSQKIGFGIGGGPTLANGDYFGHSVTSMGDLDGDGVTDLAVGADKDDTGGYNNGAVYVLFLNANGTVKSSRKIASSMSGGPAIASLDRFGSSVTSLGDLDGDGVRDIAVGASGDDTGGSYRGAVHILFLNANGTVKSSRKIASGIAGGPALADGDEFGISVASLGDLDRTGTTELAVGAFRDDTGGNGRGAVHVLFLNRDGTVEKSQKIASGIGGGPALANNDYFGRSVAALDDLDGDGVNDLAVGAYRDATGGPARGATHVLFLNDDGTVNRSTKIADNTGGGPPLAIDNRFGSGVAPIGDLDGDGVIELAVGAETDNVGGGSSRGAVHVLYLSPAPRPVRGDYNQNGIVDAADYVVWRNTLGSVVPRFSGADGNGSRHVDQGDYDVWRADFGRTTTPASAASAMMIAFDSGLEEEVPGTFPLEPSPFGRGQGEGALVHGELRQLNNLTTSNRGSLSKRLAFTAPSLRDDALVAWLASRAAIKPGEPSFDVSGDPANDAQDGDTLTHIEKSLDVAFAGFET